MLVMSPSSSAPATYGWGSRWKAIEADGALSSMTVFHARQRSEMKQATGEHDVGRKWRGRSPAPGVPRRDSVRRTQSEEREHR